MISPVLRFSTVRFSVSSVHVSFLIIVLSASFSVSYFFLLINTNAPTPTAAIPHTANGIAGEAPERLAVPFSAVTGLVFTLSFCRLSNDAWRVFSVIVNKQERRNRNFVLFKCAERHEHISCVSVLVNHIPFT